MSFLLSPPKRKTFQGQVNKVCEEKKITFKDALTFAVFDVHTTRNLEGFIPSQFTLDINSAEYLIFLISKK